MSEVIKNVIEKLSGKNEFGKSKAFFSLTHVVRDNKGLEKEIAHEFFDRAVIKIYRSLEQTIVDFIYDFSLDGELIKQINFIETFHSPENSCFVSYQELDDSFDENGTLIGTFSLHCLVLNIAEKSTKGKLYFETSDSPMSWNIIHQEYGEKKTILRMVFDTLKTEYVELSDEELKNVQKAAYYESEMEYRKDF